MRSLVIAALLLCAPALAAPGQPHVLTVVGTSDTHGRLSQLPIFASYVQALRASHGPDAIVLVDAGDAFQGTLESDLDEGKTVVEAFNALRYDAMAVGNHEFDYGPQGPPTTTRQAGGDPRGALKERLKDARFPMLAANVACKDKGCSGLDAFGKETLVGKAGGVQVGIIGVTTEATMQTTIAANVTDLRVLPIARTISERAKALREKGATVIVVAAHAGGHCHRFVAEASLATCDDKAEIFDVARALEPGLVDVIVAGHTHQAIAHKVNGVAIVQSYSSLKAFGRVDLEIDPETKRVLQATVLPPEPVKNAGVYEGEAIAPVPALEAIIAPALARAEQRKKDPLGPVLAQGLERKYTEESPLGNFVASQMLALSPGADIAIMNGGGIRADLPAGPLTYGALYQTLPFDNRFAIVKLKGKDVRHLFARNLRGENGILSVAGARVQARCDDRGLAVQLFLERKKKALADEDDVVVATNDFLATGGDDAWQGGEVRIVEDGPAIREAIAERLKQAKVSFDAQAWYDKLQPRIDKPTPRPVHCQKPDR
jgi:5'-nucleotidase